MSNSLDLLRLLEPVVRPGGLPAAAKPVAGPIETRSFDELLGEAQAMATGPPPDAAPAAGSAAPAARGPLAGLAQFDRVENPTLRRVLADRPRLG